MKKRNGFGVMAGLIGMIKPLLGFMMLAIFMGCIGNLAAAFITILGGYGLLSMVGISVPLSQTTIITLLVLSAVFRGVFRYAEQASNHYIAFKLLARIRHQVFAALRKLTPAKLDGRDKGNLVSIITSDIELLEVFYAHTISPIAIAVITSIVMVFFIGTLHPLFGAIACIFYLIVGVAIPYLNGRRGAKTGLEYRQKFGDLNTMVLDNLYGLEEILQYKQQEKREEKLSARTEELETLKKQLKKGENVQRISTDCVIMAAGALTAVAAAYLVQNGFVEFAQGLIAVVSVMSSFGPTAALSALSNDLNQTLASGERVLRLLEEEPVVTDICDGVNTFGEDISCEKISFAYPDADKKVLEQFQASFEKNKIHGIHGKSGCGKSTLLKLMMRFYETNQGEIKYNNTNVNKINTKVLRNHISYVTQETFLFHDTIENNIKIAKENATREEVIEAARKASIHDFILSLPNGYDTRLSELGDSVSGGERQRIGIARAFLHESPVIFLDEPTSNIDSLNEGIILKSLWEAKEEKTVLLVSHRKSTMGIAETIINM